MYTDHLITVDEHIAWLEKLSTDNRQIVFVIFLNDAVSGVVSLNSIDRKHKKSDWAFYLDSATRGGIGSVLEYHLLNFAFETMKLEKLNCEVIETNPAVVRMHLKFGFVEEGFRRANVIKDGKRIGVHFLGITNSDWANSHRTILAAHKSVFEKYSVNFEYDVACI